MTCSWRGVSGAEWKTIVDLAWNPGRPATACSGGAWGIGAGLCSASEPQAASSSAPASVRAAVFFTGPVSTRGARAGTPRARSNVSSFFAKQKRIWLRPVLGSK